MIWVIGWGIGGFNDAQETYGGCRHLTLNSDPPRNFKICGEDQWGNEEGTFQLPFIPYLMNRWKDNIYIFIGGLVFIWAFTLAVGWIVRGLKGIPKGQDHLGEKGNGF